MIEKLQQIQARYEELTQLLTQPEVIADQNKWQQLVKEHASLAETVELFARYQGLVSRQVQIMEDKELFAEEKELLELALQDEERVAEELAKAEMDLKLRLVPQDPEDDKNVLLEIRAGAGGDEAALFGACLMRMYQHYAEDKGWKFEIMELSMNDLGGLKEGSFMISGSQVYKKLKYESGVHRVQRVPVTESGGRIHTSTATVAVLSEADDVDVEINLSDLKIDTYRASGAGGQHVNKTESAIRITHLPTGMVVTCQDEKSQHKNREKAMKVLQTRLYDAMKEQADADYAKIRHDQVGSGDRSERIRTYNYPQGRVTDHRIGFTIYKIEQFLNGDLDEMIERLILAAQTGNMAGEQAED